MISETKQLFRFLSKKKLLSIGLIISSGLGYLEWGTDHHQFLFQMEWEVLTMFLNDPIAAIHPFTVLPMAGQLILLITLFQKQASIKLMYLGTAGIGILLLFMLGIGLFALNVKIVLSTLPFFGCLMVLLKNRNAFDF